MAEKVKINRKKKAEPTATEEKAVIEQGSVEEEKSATPPELRTVTFTCTVCGELLILQKNVLSTFRCQKCNSPKFRFEGGIRVVSSRGTILHAIEFADFFNPAERSAMWEIL